MVGTKTSGNREPKENNILFRVSSEILDYLAQRPNPKGLPKNNVVGIIFMEHEKENFIKFHGKDVYDEHMRKFNRTVTEMKKDKLKREKEKLELKREYLAFEKEKLELDKRKVAVSEANTGIRTDKAQKRKETKNMPKKVKYEGLKKKLDELNTLNKGGKYERLYRPEINEVEAEIKALDYEIPDKNEKDGEK